MPVRRTLSSLLDFIYPRPCCVCGIPVHEPGRHICWDCRSHLGVIQFPYCSWCGDPVQGQVDAAYVCAWCRRRPPQFDRARSAAHYEGAVQDTIKAFKYGKATHLVKELGAMLAGCVQVHYAREVIDAVTYVPLHRHRRRERTFNQSYLLARYVAREVGLELAAAGLCRTRNTDTQALLNAAARRRNVQDAFAVEERAGWVAGRSLLLIDDVMTTGATVDAVAATLKGAGAHRVWVATVGRGV